MRDINLLPEDMLTPEIQKQNTKPVFTVKIIIIAVAAAVLIAASLFIPKAYIKVLDLRKASIEDKLNSRAYQEVRTVNQQLEKIDGSINSKLNIVEDIDKKGCSAGSVMNTMMQCLPSGCSIEEIGINSGSVTIRGKAPSALSASEFLMNVERLGFFHVLDNLDQFTEPKNNSACNFEFTFTMNEKGGK